MARHVVRGLAGDDQISMTLFVRDADKLSGVPANAFVVQGDVPDRSVLDEATAGQGVVYANLTGDNLDGQPWSTSRIQSERSWCRCPEVRAAAAARTQAPTEGSLVGSTRTG